jgi:hypothetical protein
MKTCKACGGKYRGQGTVAIVGKKGGIVGPCCAKDGILVIGGKPAPRCKCGKLATKCHECAGAKVPPELKAAVRVLKTYASAANASALRQVDGSPEHNFHAGKVEGLESAIDLLESGRF